MNKSLEVKFEYKLQDMWLGVFWKATPAWVDIWICLVPCFPLHLSWMRRRDNSGHWPADTGDNQDGW